MDPPDSAVETETMTVWIDDGIIYLRSNGAPSTGESGTEMLAVLGGLIKGSPRPVLFDAREWPSGDAKWWSTLIYVWESYFSAAAMLIDPESPPAVGGYPAIIDRLLTPFEVFTDEAEALAFVRRNR